MNLDRTGIAQRREHADALANPLEVRCRIGLALGTADADAELRSALAFCRAVGATRYIRQAEALLATAG